MSYFLEFFLNFDLGFYKYTKGCLLALCQILRLLEPDHLPGAESAGDGKTSVCGCVGGASLARVVWTNIDLYTHFLDLQRVCQDILWHKVPKPDPIHPSIQWLHSDYILATFQPHSGYILATFLQHSDCFLTTYWLHSDYILATFRLHSGYIFATFWLHYYYILTAFLLHSDYIPTISDWLRGRGVDINEER